MDYYKLSEQQESFLLHQPETGMGYQIVEAIRQGFYSKETFLALNSQILIKMDRALNVNIQLLFKNGIDYFKEHADQITLRDVYVLNKWKSRSQVSEPKNNEEKGALDNPVENATGNEIFIRLSPFENDRRIDKINKCLLPGSFTTTLTDYNVSKAYKYDPAERYALPSNDEIKYAFYIVPDKIDTLQRGTVQPAFGKQGKGDEVYFAKGTSKGTFCFSTKY